MRLHCLLLVAVVALLACASRADAGRCPKCKPCRACPRGQHRVLVTRRVCTRSSRHCPPPKRLGSLGFVIDDTGSMVDDIAGVRSQISSILASNRIFKDFVIGRFGDPYKRKILHTSKASAVKAYLNAIRPSGGGDCPEFSMSGIRDAANEARPNSVLYLFTDASAKDANLKASVAALLKKKKTRLFVVKSGNLCGSAYKGEYDYLAKASGGSVIKLTSKSQVKHVMKYIGLASAGRVPFRLPSSIAELRRIKPGCCRLVWKFVCKKIRNPCPSGYRRVVTHRKVCPTKPTPPKPHPPKRVGSLGFVIDDTGSMGTEIGAVKSSVGSIIAANKRFKDYVMATFGDPYTRHVLKSAQKSAVLAFLNAIRPSGGGDCPEFALSGVRDAANTASRHSVLFLFTDASAKDESMKVSVGNLLKTKKTRLFVVKTGTLCGSAYKGEYDYLAKVSGGKVVSLTDKASISKVMDFIKLAAAGKASFSEIPTDLTGLTNFKPGGKCYTETLLTCRCNKCKGR